jgi:hypothetical protein
MNRKPEIIRTIDLGYEQMWVFDGGPHARMRVLYGATWLTGEGDGADSVVGAGSERALRPGRSLIEALVPSRVQIVERAGRGSALLRRWWRAARRTVTRQQFGPVVAH